MLPETGKAARVIDGALDWVRRRELEHQKQVAKLEAKLVYTAVVINQIAATASPEQVEILMDLCRTLYTPEVTLTPADMSLLGEA